MSNNLAVQVDEAVTGAAGQFVSTLSQYKWDLLPDSQLHAAKQALTKSDYIMKIAAGDANAVHGALVQSAILGLDLTEGKRQGWLLPRKNQNGKTVIQLQVGYKGVEAIHQRMGVIDRLVIRVVRKNDTFEWSGDDAEKPKHDAEWFASDDVRGEISGAFAITYFPDGSINVTTAPITDISRNTVTAQSLTNPIKPRKTRVSGHMSRHGYPMKSRWLKRPWLILRLNNGLQTSEITSNHQRFWKHYTKQT